MATRPDKAEGRPEPRAISSVEELFRDHNDSLVRFLRARLTSEADAREAAQESYVRLLQLDQRDQPSFLRAYLFKIAANVATDMLRQKASRKTTSMAEPPDELVPPPQERALLARQHLVQIEKALLSLPPKCREAFRLSRHEGCSPSEIATRIGVTDRMVRNYLSRALEHIHQAIDGNTTGPSQ